MTAISAHCSVTVLSHHGVVHSRDSVPPPGVDHPVHLLPLTGEGVELQDVIRRCLIAVYKPFITT